MKHTRLFLGLAFALFVLITGSASATIVFDTGVTDIQQQENRPCVIGDQSCKEPTNFGYAGFSGTPGGGNGSQYDLFSPTYLAGNSLVGNAASTLDQIPSSFTIGVDENIAAGVGAEALVFFKTYVCTGAASTCTTSNTTDGKNGGGGGAFPATLPTGLTLDAGNSYVPVTPTPIPNAHNGNGFSDFGLTGFNLTAGQNYVFEVSVLTDTDGMEEFFIVPQAGPGAIPEPSTLLLLGSGLLGLGGMVWRRNLK